MTGVWLPFLLYFWNQVSPCVFLTNHYKQDIILGRWRPWNWLWWVRVAFLPLPHTLTQVGLKTNHTPFTGESAPTQSGRQRFHVPHHLRLQQLGKMSLLMLIFISRSLGRRWSWNIIFFLRGSDENASANMQFVVLKGNICAAEAFRACFSLFGMRWGDLKLMLPSSAIGNQEITSWAHLIETFKRLIPWMFINMLGTSSR